MSECKHGCCKDLVKALELVDEVWERTNLHPDVNFMGDDEHEAWSGVKGALANHRRIVGEGKVSCKCGN